MTAKQQHDHSWMKLYVVRIGGMDNAKLRWYQDRHTDRWLARQARRRAKIERRAVRERGMRQR